MRQGGGDIKDNAEAEMRLEDLLPRIWRTRSGSQIGITNLARMIWMRLDTHFVCCRKCKNCIQRVAVPGLLGWKRSLLERVPCRMARASRRLIWVTLRSSLRRWRRSSATDVLCRLQCCAETSTHVE